MKIKNCLLLLLLCLSHGFLGAQYYNLTFRNYSSNNGLSQSEVECVFEDSHGFLWVGTRYGLTRYDGRDFRTFFHHIEEPHSIGENVIMDIDEDSKGFLWIAVYNSGISRMNPLNARFLNWGPSPGQKNSLVSSKIKVIHIDKGDRVWIGTEAGLSVYDQYTRQFFNISYLPGDSSAFHILCIEEDPDGNMWIGTRSNGLWLMKKDTENISRVFSPKEISAVNKILFDTSGLGWLAADEGLFSFKTWVNENGANLKKAVFFKSNVALEDMEIDGRGNFWLATKKNGLMIYFPSSGLLDELKEDYASARGLLSNRLMDIYKDKRGGIWIGGENGLQSFHDAAQKFYIYPGLSSISEKVRGASIYGLSKRDNDLLMATSGGILIYNRLSNKFITVKTERGMADKTIRFRSFYRQSADAWWVCSDAGIFELKYKNDYYILKRPAVLAGLPVFYNESFRNHLKAGDGKLWFATTDNGVILFDPETKLIKRFMHIANDSSGLSDNACNIIAFDRDSNLLVGHEAGLSVMKKGSSHFTNIYYDVQGRNKSLSSRYVYDIYDDGMHYWLATYGGGLNVVAKKDYTVSYFTTRNGLCSDAVYTIVPQADSFLWLGTNKGLSRFNIRQKSFENFQQNDGIPADEFNMLSKYTDETGEIFMATINGLTSFKPENISLDLIPPRVYLSRVRLNGQYLNDSLTAVINRDKMITIKFGEDLYLEFSPMVFSGNSNSVLRYNIKELGNQWKTSEAGTLLPLVKTEPGNYTIAIRIFNGQGKNASDMWNLRLIVQPPFWKTLQFRVALALAILLTAFFIIRNYIRQRLERQKTEFERQQAVEKERSRISGELHDDIGGGLTAIRLMSEMMINKQVPGPQKITLEKISDSANDLIQKMNEIVWALNVNNDNLQSLIAYTRRYAVSYLDDLNLQYKLLMPDDIPDLTVTGKNRRSIFLIVKEALNNVAKHAGAGCVSISVSITDKLSIEVHDDGKGIDLNNLHSGGQGLSNIRKRAAQLEGNIEIRNNKGTSIVLDIPLENLSA